MTSVSDHSITYCLRSFSRYVAAPVGVAVGVTLGVVVGV
jgi:hypothetical protein